ncbi:MAG: hypothetical protein IJO73_04900 [Clostridia bacterium]|nr:hypothetical protein [Clostridia bacterium]
MIELVSNNKDISIINENSNKINLTSNYSNINLTTEEENIELKDDKNYIEFSASSAVVVDSPVKSVNGKVGDVVLTAADVGALPDTTIIPDTTGLATESYVDIKASEEVTARVTADILLQNKIDVVEANYKEADTELQTRLDAEVEVRAENHLAMRAECKAEVDEVKALVTAETTRALAVESELESAIEAETVNRDKAIKEAVEAIPSADLTGYATEIYVDNKINNLPIPDTSGLASIGYVDTKIADVVGTAPEALDTLNELAAALGNDKNFSTTISNEIGKKVDKV